MSSAFSPATEADNMAKRKNRLVTAAEMRELDRRTIETYGLPGAVLMENAGRAIAQAAAGFKGRSAVLFCGQGNNGGDGCVAARVLRGWGWKVKMVLAKPPARFRGDAALHWNVAKKLKIPALVYKNAASLKRFVGRPAIVVDALLGTGVRLPIEEPYCTLIEQINQIRRPVVSADIPSGMDADTGVAGNPCVRAARTVTMGFVKRGLVKKRAKRWVGRLEAADIGIIG